jgi:hypothetical protein
VDSKLGLNDFPNKGLTIPLFPAQPGTFIINFPRFRGIIHLIGGYPQRSVKKDPLAIETIGEALAGSGKPFVTSSGMLFNTPDRPGTEEDAGDFSGTGVYRVPPEEMTLALVLRGVRAIVIRLPPSVHGKGDYGFIPGVIEIAHEKGVSAYVVMGSIAGCC